jgi:hypothetical protein
MPVGTMNTCFKERKIMTTHQATYAPNIYWIRPRMTQHDFRSAGICGLRDGIELFVVTHMRRNTRTCSPIPTSPSKACKLLKSESRPKLGSGSDRTVTIGSLERIFSVLGGYDVDGCSCKKSSIAFSYSRVLCMRETQILSDFTSIRLPNESIRASLLLSTRLYAPRGIHRGRR